MSHIFIGPHTKTILAATLALISAVVAVVIVACILIHFLFLVPNIVFSFALFSLVTSWRAAKERRKNPTRDDMVRLSHPMGKFHCT